MLTRKTIILLKILITVIISFFAMAPTCGSSFDGSEKQQTDLGGGAVSKPVSDISFVEHTTLNNYGTDILSTSSDAYISIISNFNSTHFLVRVKNYSNGAKAISQNASIVDVTSPAQLANSMDNDVTLGSKASDLWGSVAININACTGEQNPDPCYVFKNSITVKVYAGRSIDLKLTILNNASFSTTNLKNDMNGILKQGAYSINNIIENQQPWFSQSGYDKNSNGILDLWISSPIPPEDEFDDLKTISQSNGFWSNGSPGIVIVKNPIRVHWGLEFDIISGAHSVLVTSDANLLQEGDYITIGPLTGSDSIETMYVTGISNNYVNMQKSPSDINGLYYDHPEKHTIWSDVKLKGQADPQGDDFAVLGENATHRIATHEFLHMKTQGQLLHVVDVDNIMHANANLTGTKLRYRPIANPDGNPDQKQWSMLSNTSF